MARAKVRAKVAFLAGVVVLSVLVGFSVSPSHADIKDLGEVCVSFSFGNAGIPPATQIFGVLVYGASQQHILLTSTGTPAHGSAVLAGAKVVVTLNSSTVSDDSIVGSFMTIGPDELKA